MHCARPGIVRTIDKKLPPAGDDFDYSPQTGVESAKCSLDVCVHRAQNVVDTIQINFSIVIGNSRTRTPVAW